MKGNLSADIVCEQTGDIFSITTDGKTITCIPKYQSNSLVISRFYKFLVENIDPNIKLIGDLENENKI